jgi:hypothetical protein
MRTADVVARAFIRQKLIAGVLISVLASFATYLVSERWSTR